MGFDHRDDIAIALKRDAFGHFASENHVKAQLLHRHMVVDEVAMREISTEFSAPQSMIAVSADGADIRGAACRRPETGVAMRMEHLTA
jgi:hypothetical protein